jgi:predicted transcriptional regulator of viral defense system
VKAHPDTVIAAFAARQRGHVTTGQLLAAGVDRGAIGRRVRSGLLIRLWRGVYAVGHVSTAQDAIWFRAVLAGGPGAVLSVHDAAAGWELRPPRSAPVHITVPGRGGRARRRGLVVHRSALPRAEITIHRGIPITTVARTLLDVAATLRRSTLTRTVERAEILRLFDLKAIERTLARHRNHRGARALAGVLDLYRDDEFTRSELEAMMLAVLDEHGIERPLVNHEAAGEEVDLLWPRRRLVVETDGRATHLTRAAFERDRAKDVRLTVAGYTVVRFTYMQLLHDPRAVVATLRALLS